MGFVPVSRRGFLQGVAFAGATAGGWSRVLGANERLRVAAIGVSGKGWSDHTSVAASPHVEIVALCDVDEGPEHLGRGAARYPKAERFNDWRVLLDRARDFDAVIVS